MIEPALSTERTRHLKVQKIYFETAAPDEESFSSFTFKIQANMDPAYPGDIIGKEINLSNAIVFMVTEIVFHKAREHD